MSMHRVSEHREEDEIDPDDNLAQRNKKKVSGSLNMAAADAANSNQEGIARDSPSISKSSKLSQKKKSHLVFNNQWTLDEEDRNKAAAAGAGQQDEGQAEPNSDEIGPLPSTESPSKKKSRYQSTKPPMYSYAANQQESTTQGDEEKQPTGSNIMNKRPSTRDRVANTVGSQSTNNTNQYFSRTQNQQQIDGSPGGGSSANQLPPKKALTN